jgi:two-component system, response regulator
MNKVLLLVEDNATDEKLAVRALMKSGVAPSVVIARDGAEALDYLFATGIHAGRDRSVLPALVLLDLQLPRIDGLEVLRRIRANDGTRCLPVVILTASRRSEDIARGYSFGANAYVRKSVEFAEFAEAMRTIGVFWLQMNELPPPGSAE